MSTSSISPSIYPLRAAVLEVTAGLLAAGDDADPNAFAFFLPHDLLSSAERIAVEAASQATIGRHDDDDAVLHFVMRIQQRVVLQPGIPCRRNEHVGQSRRPRQRILHADGRTANLRRRDHFHGTRDLLRRCDGVDASLYVVKVRHSSLPYADGANCTLKASMALTSASVVSSVNFFSSAMLLRIWGHCARKYSRSSPRKRTVSATGTSSR